MERRPPSSIEQLRRVSDDVERNWQETVDALRTAIFELVTDLTDEEKQQLINFFWPSSGEILKRYEAYSPGLTEAVMGRFEQICLGRRELEGGFDIISLPQAKVKRRGFLRSIIDRPSEETS